MDLAPLGSVYKKNIASFRYSAIKYATGPKDANGILQANAVHQMLPFSGGITNPVLIVPSLQKSLAYYSLTFDMSCFLHAANNSASLPQLTPWTTTAKIIRLGNSDANQSFRIDGAPVQQSFTHEQQFIEINSGSPVSKIDISELYGEFKTDLANLLTSPVFTADPTDPSWELCVVINPLVIASWH